MKKLMLSMASLACMAILAISSFATTATASSGLMMPANTAAALMLHNHGPDVLVETTADTALILQTVQADSIGLIYKSDLTTDENLATVHINGPPGAAIAANSSLYTSVSVSASAHNIPDIIPLGISQANAPATVYYSGPAPED